MDPNAPSDPNRPSPTEAPLLAALLHHSQSAMALSTWPEGIMLEANDAWSRVTGWEPEILIGRPISTAEFFHDWTEVEAILQTLAEQGEATNAPLTIRNRGG